MDENKSGKEKVQTKTITTEECAQCLGCVLTYGHFSTIHPGHIRYLRHAKSLGKKLAIGLIGDKAKAKYNYTQQERTEALTFLGLADYIILMEDDNLKEVLEKMRPEVLVLGNEFKEMHEMKDALDTVKEQGGKLQFHAGGTQNSTTELLSNSESEIVIDRRKKFRAACERQIIKRKDLENSIQQWENARLIVIGDTIVDQYAACEALGMSAEAPVVVVKEIENKNFIGGAAIVAAHISALGAKCRLVSVVGEDSTATFVKDELMRLNIGDNLCIDSTRPTTFKKRYVVENQKLFRVSKLEERNIEKSIEDEVIQQLEKEAVAADGIIVSDFVYGVITPRILETIKKLAEKHNLLLLGDLQCSSQVGSITKFENYSLLCPNEREARLSLQDKDSGVEQLSQKVLQVTNAGRLVMKLGSEGFIAYDKDKEGGFRNQAFPALSANPVDVAGAGDSLLAVFATGLASNQGMMITAALACCMAAHAVETMGNTPITSNKLRASIKEIFKK